ncbi:MAG: ABC transporter permease subunit [Promethearchaeota archaeon]
MSLKILFIDELKGFYKSKVMIVLWIGMPLIALLFHYFQPDTQGFPISSLVSLIISSIGGTLSSVMLSTSIVNEKNRHVYELFLIRPVKRRNLLIAKFLAVYLCLTIAIGISIGIGIIIDVFINKIPLELNTIFGSLFTSMAIIAISCSLGTLFGVLVSSVSVAAILSVYLGNQLSAVLILPTFLLDFMDPLIVSPLLGSFITILLMGINIILFNRQQF